MIRQLTLCYTTSDAWREKMYVIETRVRAVVVFSLNAKHKNGRRS